MHLCTVQKEYDMARIVELENGQTFRKGYITLIGSTGKRYSNLALNIPGYGMVPCSRKLSNDFTNQSDDLLLVISERDDVVAPVTSNIWVTRRSYNVLCTISL